ncbi:MAG: DUF2934 domain-containing protein [Terriglobia bacterium]|jgi:hypothetical protein|nr:DUF2934 domain-containing protein [Terriglobia bacterium]
MAKEKKATGEVPRKRTSRKTPVAVAQETAQQVPENGNVQAMQASGSQRNGSDELIRQRAYELWEQRGRQHGRDADDWYRAESELRGKSA